MIVKTTVYWEGLIFDSSEREVDTGVVEVILYSPNDRTTGQIVEYDVKEVKELVIHKRVVT